ncbi:hypothetical protein AAE485_12330 [Acidithiobacillus ferriphilus]|uniref:hypothetical protein n=1 Tax=Acidithiobacillus ferriphilus TaxID=1689834 RepID=UPI00390C7294
MEEVQISRLKPIWSVNSVYSVLKTTACPITGIGGLFLLVVITEAVTGHLHDLLLAAVSQYSAAFFVLVIFVIFVYAPVAVFMTFPVKMTIGTELPKIYWSDHVDAVLAQLGLHEKELTTGTIRVFYPRTKSRLKMCAYKQVVFDNTEDASIAVTGPLLLSYRLRRHLLFRNGHGDVPKER